MWSLFIFGFYEKKKKKACDLRPFEALITQKVQCFDLQLNLNQKWLTTHIISSVDKTKLPSYTPTDKGITVSSEKYPCYKKPVSNLSVHIFLAIKTV